MREALAGNDRDRLEAVSRPRAGSWLTAFPNRALGLWMPTGEFRGALQIWLGLVHKTDQRALRRAGSGMCGRHQSIRDVIFEAARAADMRPWREAAVDASRQWPSPSRCVLARFFSGSGLVRGCYHLAPFANNNHTKCEGRGECIRASSSGEISLERGLVFRPLFSKWGGFSCSPYLCVRWVLAFNRRAPVKVVRQSG